MSSSRIADAFGVALAIAIASSSTVVSAQDIFDESAPESDDGSNDGTDGSDGATDEGTEEASPPPSTATEPASGFEDPESNPDLGGRGQGDRAAAESLVRVGKGLIELGRYDEACAKLEQSLEAYALGDAALLLGECYERLGKLASSWAAYRQAAARYRAARDAKREVALTRARRLEPKVPKLTLLTAQRLPGMRIMRDDTEFGVGVLGVPLAVDPGVHRLGVRAHGYEPWVLEVELKPSERRTLDIPTLTRADADETTGAKVYRGRGPLFYAGVIVAGTGVASVASGVLLAASASRDVNTAESTPELCGASRICTPEGRDLVDRADRKAIAATVTLAAGAAAVATGFILVVVDPGASVAEVGVHVGPLVGPGVGGLTLGGSF